MTRAALKWILSHDAVTSVIPGFKTVQQVEDNLAAMNVPEFSESELEKLREFYQLEVHDSIRGPY